MSTVLVTGGSGFVGSHCLLQLLAVGHHVRATVRDLTRASVVRALLKEGGAEPGDSLTLIAADLEKECGWIEAVTGCEYVLHVASPLPAKVPRNEDETDRPRTRRLPPCAAGFTRRRRETRRADLIFRGHRVWPYATEYAVR